MEHFKAELINYMDYYNNKRIKVKLKAYRLLFTATSPCIIKYLSNFLGSLHLLPSLLYCHSVLDTADVQGTYEVTYTLRSKYMESKSLLSRAKSGNIGCLRNFLRF